MSEPSAAPALPRIPTRIPGLDEVTGGGFLQSGVYILQGVPGAGKTILANQIVHRHAAEGGKVVYVTMLAESHGRLLQHMQRFSFFDPAALPEQVYYVSAFQALRSGGLNGVVELLRQEMRTRAASMVVLDGLVMAASAAASDEALKIFVSDIQAHSALTGCTTLLLASEHADRPVSAEQTMVDGILLLRDRAHGVRRERSLEVVKFRGSGTLRGEHAFRIGDDGIALYPRLEAARRQSAGDAVRPEPVATGVAGLDTMFGIGGFPRGGIVAVSGPAGAGKTTLALHFLAAAPAGEKSVFLGFYESPQLLARMAAADGIAPAALQNVEFLWQPFGEVLLDGVASELLQRVAATGARRVVIDGVGGLSVAPAYGQRDGPFVAALVNELRRLGATSMVTVEEAEERANRAVDTPTMSALSDTLLELYFRQEETLRRFLGIRKCRVSRCDLRLRELVLGPSGLEVARQEGSGGS